MLAIQPFLADMRRAPKPDLPGTKGLRHTPKIIRRCCFRKLVGHRRRWRSVAVFHFESVVMQTQADFVSCVSINSRSFRMQWFL